MLWKFEKTESSRFHDISWMYVDLFPWLWLSGCGCLLCTFRTIASIFHSKSEQYIGGCFDFFKWLWGNYNQKKYLISNWLGNLVFFALFYADKLSVEKQ